MGWYNNLLTEEARLDTVDGDAYITVEKRPDNKIRVAIETDIEVESEVYLTPMEAAALAIKISQLVYETRL